MLSPCRQQPPADRSCSRLADLLSAIGHQPRVSLAQPLAMEKGLHWPRICHGSTAIYRHVSMHPAAATADHFGSVERSRDYGASAPTLHPHLRLFLAELVFQPLFDVAALGLGQRLAIGAGGPQHHLHQVQIVEPVAQR